MILMWLWPGFYKLVQTAARALVVEREKKLM
jgi:hypothetical protein